MQTTKKNYVFELVGDNREIRWQVIHGEEYPASFGVTLMALSEHTAIEFTEALTLLNDALNGVGKEKVPDYIDLSATNFSELSGVAHVFESMDLDFLTCRIMVKAWMQESGETHVCKNLLKILDDMEKNKGA